MQRWVIMGLLLALGAGGALAQGFKFSDDDRADAERAQAARANIQALLASPCHSKLKNRKIMVVLAEQRDGLLLTTQSGYSAHVQAINARLQSLGLKTATPAQIKAQVAQAEIDAYFKNDPDAALAASKRLAAQYGLRGLISSQSAYNSIARVHQVSVQMHFTLTDAAGKVLSQVQVDDASYSGADTQAMALTLIQEQAEGVVAQLYSDYCRLARP